MNTTRINAFDGRPPHRVRLQSLSAGLSHFINEPPGPSPTICWNVVSRIFGGALRGPGAEWDVYPDDILVMARGKEVAGALINPKREFTAATEINHFSWEAHQLHHSVHGKHLNSVTWAISNTVDMLVASMPVWVRGLGTRCMVDREMACLRGHLQWGLRPLGGALPSLTGPIPWCAHAPHTSHAHYPEPQALCFLCPSLYIPSALPHTCVECGSHFRIGVVWTPRVYRNYMCLCWVTSVQQLYWAYAALKVTVGCT